ncbi:tyrosine-type recombinase/integrase [Natronomonas sp. CBA1123]|jgi:integrase/recombinase XerD|uniref:tyrosine-type recombinase/integrase n=1 Tax=Natronomonas sp. CBA1123 TaxID=2668070 RepID=UPI0012EAA2FA|nr:tyrosine-type recombinase/integrase [Natronomonas sp. CBA1123]MUV85534.1 tyrosine-type recombinase/integrase [Natronomonas sp. CBA1123]
MDFLDIAKLVDSMNEESQSPVKYRVPDEYAQEYLRRNDGIVLAKTTVKSYDSLLTQYVEFLHSRDCSVLDAQLEDVVCFIEDCVRHGNRESTIQGKLTTISELYRYIRLWTDAGDELALEPLRLRQIDTSKYRTPQPIERVALSREEIRRLFDSFNSYRNRLIAIVAIETALRNSDLRSIRIEDVDIEASTIYVPNPKNSKPYIVPISDELSYELEIWIRGHRGGFALGGPYLFPGQTKEQLGRNESLNKIIVDAAEKAGIQGVIGRSRLSTKQQQMMNTEKEYREWKRVTVHTLRHSCITLLEEAGVSLPYRQLIANHSTSETTKGYSHGSRDGFESIRAKFDPPR